MTKEEMREDERLVSIAEQRYEIDELGSNLRHLEYQISQELKLPESVRERAITFTASCPTGAAYAELQNGEQ